MRKRKVTSREINHIKSEIVNDIDCIESVLACGIISPENSGHPLLFSAFIEIMIFLRDLMYKSDKYAKRIDFKYDVKEDKDITSLIEYVRNAVCHVDSPNHEIEPFIKASFNVIFGKGLPIMIGNNVQENPFDDDICFCFGSQHIALQHHIRLSLNEAKVQLNPLLTRIKAIISYVYPEHPEFFGIRLPESSDWVENKFRLIHIEEGQQQRYLQCYCCGDDVVSIVEEK